MPSALQKPYLGQGIGFTVPVYNYTHIVGALSTQIGVPNTSFGTGSAQSTIAGVFHSIVVNNIGTTSSFIVYDVAGTTTTGAKIIASSGTVAAGTGPYVYDAAFVNGLLIVTTGTTVDITVMWL